LDVAALIDAGAADRGAIGKSCVGRKAGAVANRMRQATAKRRVRMVPVSVRFIGNAQ
jgi:hypothetical protein